MQRKMVGPAQSNIFSRRCIRALATWRLLVACFAHISFLLRVRRSLASLLWTPKIATKTDKPLNHVTPLAANRVKQKRMRAKVCQRDD
jgi:hypothetical protein